MNEQINIIDESGDKKYFTIIPNYIFNHSTLWDREVYCQMKRIAGENGTCWMSRKKLAEQCGISLERLKKSIKYLIEHKWIESVGKKEIMTRGGEQGVCEYKISDLWNINNSFYQDKSKGGSPDSPPSRKGGSPIVQRGVANRAKGGRQIAPNKNHVNKNHLIRTIAPTSGAEGEVIPNLIEDPKKHIQIIGYFALANKVKFTSKQHQQVYIKRHTRAAADLVCYDIEKIKDIMRWLFKNTDFKWTLETVAKYIDTDLNRLKSDKHKIVVCQ